MALTHVSWVHHHWLRLLQLCTYSGMHSVSPGLMRQNSRKALLDHVHLIQNLDCRNGPSADPYKLTSRREKTHFPCFPAIGIQRCSAAKPGAVSTSPSRLVAIDRPVVHDFVHPLLKALHLVAILCSLLQSWSPQTKQLWPKPSWIPTWLSSHLAIQLPGLRSRRCEGFISKQPIRSGMCASNCLSNWTKESGEAGLSYKVQDSCQEKRSASSVPSGQHECWRL